MGDVQTARQGRVRWFLRVTARRMLAHSRPRTGQADDKPELRVRGRRHPGSRPSSGVTTRSARHCCDHPPAARGRSPTHRLIGTMFEDGDRCSRGLDVGVSIPSSVSQSIAQGIESARRRCDSDRSM